MKDRVSGNFLDVIQRSSRVLVALVLILFMLVRVVPFSPQRTGATHPGGPPHLFLLWDGTDGTIPSGWSRVSTYDGFFVRGDTVANFGTMDSSGTHAPTVSSTTIGAASGTYYNSGGNSPFVAAAAHSHSGGVATPGTANNNDEPAYRSLKLIRYDNGIPTFIPAGVIAMFDTLPTSGWTEYTAAHNRFLKIDSTVANGGTDAHQHQLTYSDLTNPTLTQERSSFLASQPTSTATHTHTVATTNTASITTFPPHVRPLIAKANINTTAVPANLLGFFDAVPGTGWVVRSDSGGDFNGQFLRLGPTFNGTTQGSASHTHANAVVTASNNTGGNPGNTLNLLGAALASTHNHTVTTAFNAVENLPNYVNLVIAEKINFILRDYRWFEDSDDEDVTDPWGRIDVAQNTPIFITPARNDPPSPAQELRLRLKLEVSGQDLPVSGIAFNLQYSEGTDSDCSAGVWTDVGSQLSGSIWRFAVSSISLNTQLSASRLSPAASVRETYNKQNPTVTNASSVSVGLGIEYDFHIEHNSADNARRYKFRIIESTGPPLAEYAVCPALTTKPGTENTLRHGDVFEGGFKRGFSWAD